MKKKAKTFWKVPIRVCEACHYLSSNNVRTDSTCNIVYVCSHFEVEQFPVYPSFCQFTILSNVSKERQLFCGLIVHIFLNVPIMRFSVNQDCGFVVFDLVNK